jgi:hypothetical protein
MSDTMSIAELQAELARRTAELKALTEAKYEFDAGKLTVTIPGITTEPRADMKASEYGNFTLWQSGATRFTRGVVIGKGNGYTLKFEGRVYLVPVK